MPLRSCWSRRLATDQPPFRGPIRSSFGAFTSVMKVSQKGEFPAIRRIGRTSTPGWRMEKTTKDMPSCFFDVSVRTRHKIMSAHWAPDVQIFEPLTRKGSPLSSARVCREARSEPAPGSEKPWHQRTRPWTMSGMYFCFWASVPYSSRVGPNMLTPMPTMGFTAPIAAISCWRMRTSSRESPPPPYWVGQVGTPQPLAPMRSFQTAKSPLGGSGDMTMASSAERSLRREAGKFASSQSRASERKASSPLSPKSAIRNTP